MKRIVALFALLLATPVQAAEFYEGKTLTVLLTTTAGGGYDAHMRYLVAHIGKHIPGNPTVLPQNKPGAAGLVGMNYVANAAPKDGSVVMLTTPNTIVEPLYGNTKAQYDARAFQWVGAMERQKSICIGNSKAATLEKATQSGIVFGGSGATGGHFGAMAYGTAYFLGLPKPKVVLGYRGGAPLILAARRGEVDVICGLTYSPNVQDLISKEGMHLILQLSGPKVPIKVPQLADITPKTSAHDRQVYQFLFGSNLYGKMLGFAPEVPEEAVRAVRTGFRKVMNDPNFLAEARAKRFELEYVSASEYTAFVGTLLATPRETVAHTVGITRPKTD